jgi:hypothetical protein
MSQWEMLLNHLKNLQHMKACIKAGLAAMYKHYKKMDRTNAYVIAMCT